MVHWTKINAIDNYFQFSFRIKEYKNANSTNFV